MALIDGSEAIAGILKSARTVAVLGAHDDPLRAACYVPDYLARQGYRVLPVNPTRVGATLWGEPVLATLREVSERYGQVDIVDVFRRPEDLAQHLEDLLAMAPPPRCVWLQSGIRSAAFVRELVARGLDVVEDRCTLQDHRLLVGARAVQR